MTKNAFSLPPFASRRATIPMCFVSLALLLSACGSSPFIASDESTGTTGDTTGITGGNALPPGTASPSATSGISRTEDTQGGQTGDGTATGFSYNAAGDTFTVDGLAFDGNNSYSRGLVSQVASLGPFAVYENAATFTDTFPTPDSTINQFAHRLIYGVSTSGTSRFAIVRTGAYIDYGFGGFVYERDGSVTLPTTGQASYSGAYAAIRDFSGRGGLEYSQGTATMAIDFADFNDGEGVSGAITGRTVFDINGKDITSTITDALTTQLGVTITALPSLVFTIGPGTLDANGEATNELKSNVTNSGGAAQTLESGNYYAIISGDNAEEIVGVVAVTSTDARFTGVTVRETGGFIVYR